MKKLFALLVALFVSFNVAACSPVIDPNTEYTLTQLAEFDGLNGAKAYIAVNGIVYDVTNEDEWDNGTHQGMHLAGTDATAIFGQSPHSQAFLDGLTQIGVVVEETAENSSSFQQTLPVFTLAQLSEFTGANGTTAYIAVSGVVYDVTSEFTNGTHKGLQLGGTDVTAAFASSPHSQTWLNQLTIVGTLEGHPTIDTSTPSTGSYLPVFTLAQLSTYTGANGTTAYIAVSGKIYNVTSVFYNGTHQGMQLGGTDATAIFASSPHPQDWLNQLTIVGSLEGAPLIPSTTTGGTGTGDDDDDDDYGLSLDDLPQAIQDYIASHYPTAVVDEIEREDDSYEVEFTNDIELYFTLEGQFIRSALND